jgi:Cellulase (glycosyl hydrolase family 5)
MPTVDRTRRLAAWLMAALGAMSLPSVGCGASRPSVNRGTGFFVLDGKLYDPKGEEFRIRGVNRVHWDSDSADGIARSHANTVRWDIDFNRGAALNVGLVTAQSIARHEVPIVGNWAGTCSNDPSRLEAIVSTWEAQAPQWRHLDGRFILNIANEWGPADSTVWRDAYIGAVRRLRAAGYLAPLLIDSGGCGQDMQDLARYSQAVFDSDPQRNILFAIHLYGNTNDYSASIRSVHRGDPTVITLDSDAPNHPLAPGFNGHNNSWSGLSAYRISGARGMTLLNGVQPAKVNVGGVRGAWTVTLQVDSTRWPAYTGGGTLVDYNGNYAVRIARLAALGREVGAAYIVGEFGPGENIGSSPTTVTPAEIIRAAESHGIGWLAWAWDDMNMPGCRADDRSFSMTHACGRYRQPADLTRFGRDVVLNPEYGLAAKARTASIF